MAKYNSDALVEVDGRDVTVTASVGSNDAKASLIKVADNVWGVRKTDSNIEVAEAVLPSFDFNGTYNNGRLHLSGIVDDNNVLSQVDDFQAVLPPTTVITKGALSTGAADLIYSAEKVETGVAALTQLNNGSLKITDKDFILTGTVSDQDRLDAISRLLATRADVLAPLNVTKNISIDDYLLVTSACRTAIANTMKNNTVNYKVNYYQVEEEFAGKLDAIADLVNGVCANQISQVLVEGHADITGAERYNQGLSERRAAAAQDYLEQRGVAYQYIAAFGYGEFRPIASNETNYGRSQNRRTEIHLTTIPVNTTPAGASHATQISTLVE